MYGLVVAALAMAGAKVGQRIGWVDIFRLVVVAFACSALMMVFSPSVSDLPILRIHKNINPTMLLAHSRPPCNATRGKPSAPRTPTALWLRGDVGSNGDHRVHQHRCAKLLRVLRNSPVP
jgi:hypothetical protein